jgi:phosphoribosylanthranilate isomerase
MTTQVKICSVAREADLINTLSEKPDAIGFIFWPRSPRAVVATDVADWTRDRVPTSIRKVGVFVDQPLSEVLESAKVAGLDVVQLHGHEDVDYISSIPVPVWKVFHLERLPADWEGYPVEAYVVDSGAVDMPGGTGRRVDVDRARRFVEQSKKPVWLAGGLNAGNVGDAIAQVKPFGVDVSSGVELAPGRKDPVAVRDFIHAVRNPLTPIDL